MATVLCVWELGGGMGHLVNLLPLVRGLRAAGHRVVLALRDLSRAKAVFADTGAILLPAPYKPGPPSDPVMVPRSYAHVLWNVGFGDPPELESLVEAWRNLYDLVKPDLIVFEHSPTALLAARGLDARKVTLGNGFLCPPDCTPLPDLRPWLPPDPDSIVRGEEIVLKHTNAVLERLGQPPLGRLSRLTADVDDDFLTTFAEFDDYSKRGEARYRGSWLPDGGAAPSWPNGSGKRIFACVRPFSALPQLFACLKHVACPVIVSGSVPLALRKQCAAANICFESRSLDLKQVATDCDLAILNGNHATTLAMHLAGKPVLHIPVFLEQELNARATVRLGAGLLVQPSDGMAIPEAFSKLLHDPSLAESARRFAVKHTGFSAQAEIAAVVARLQGLVL